MIKPQAYEALQKAKALFRHPAEADDIPADATAVEPIRKPRVVLIPPSDAPKFTKESMKAEHKQDGVQQAFAKLSVIQAVEKCMNSGITKPARIAELTGKPAKQIYTALWKAKKNRAKGKTSLKSKPRAEACVNTDFAYEPSDFVMPRSLEKADAMLARKKAFEVKSNWEVPSWEAPTDDFDPRREPTPFEDAHMVVLKSRAEYEAEIEQLHERIGQLLLEKQEQSIVIKYLEGKSK